MGFLKSLHARPICKKCGSLNVKHLKEDIFKCVDCDFTFEYDFGLGFDNDEIFRGYHLFLDYDNFMRAKYFSRFLSLSKKDIFLDAGCSFGFFTLYSGMLVKHAVGIDIERWRLRKARDRKNKMGIQTVDFKYANLYAIPYPNGYFDKVLCAEVLEHILRPKEAIRELTRVCNQTLVIQVPTDSFLKNIGEKVFGSDFKDSESVEENESKSLPHIQRYTAKSMIDLIESNNFKVTDVVAVRIIPLNLLTNNRFCVSLEYFFDVTFGTCSPFNALGTMTIVRAQRLS